LKPAPERSEVLQSGQPWAQQAVPLLPDVDDGDPEAVFSEADAVEWMLSAASDVQGEHPVFLRLVVPVVFEPVAVQMACFAAVAALDGQVDWADQMAGEEPSAQAPW
jgi:hypothetical protein